MPLIDLSTVTEALRLAIRDGVGNSQAWSPNPPPAVETFAPEDMTGEGLTWYLYGVGEDSLVGNQPGHPATRPLGLELHYQLCAHGGADPPTTADTQRQHLLLGLAMKALHNIPRLEAGVRVGGLDLFTAANIDPDNNMSVVLNRTTPEQAVAWWNASQSGPKAAVYYTVSVALVQEDPSTLPSPPVLTREVHGFAGMAPFITGTSNTTQLAIPGQAVQTMTTAPAQVTPGTTFRIHGSGFADDIAVLLRRPGDDEPMVVPGASVQVAGGIETITVQLPERIDGGAVIPGLTGLWVTRTETRTGRSGDPVELTTESNITTIHIVTAVRAVTQPGGAGTPYEVEGGPFADPSIAPDSVRILLGTAELTAAAAAPGPGEYELTSATTLRFQPPAAITVPTRLRVAINGTENLPFWMVPP